MTAVDYLSSLEEVAEKNAGVVIQQADKQIGSRINKKKLCWPLSSAARAKAGTRDEQIIEIELISGGVGGRGFTIRVCARELENKARNAKTLSTANIPIDHGAYWGTSTFAMFKRTRLGDNAATATSGHTPIGVDGSGRLRLRLWNGRGNGEEHGEEIHRCVFMDLMERRRCATM